MTRRLILEADLDVCPNCGSSELVVDFERAQIICKNCGVVVKEGIADLGPEWRRPESSRAYSGKLGTVMGNIEKGEVKVSDKLKAIALMKFSKPISTALERVETDLKEFLESAREKLNIPRAIIDETIALYKKLYDKGYRGPRAESYAAALLFVMKKHGIGTATLKNITEKLGVERSGLISAYMELMKFATQLGIKPPRTDPKIYIPKIVSSLSIGDKKSAEVTRLAVDILRYIISSHRIRNGRKPQVLAAAAVYYACFIAGIQVTQRELAKAADSTEGPLRELLRELGRHLYIEITI